MLVNTSEEEWDAVIRVHLKGHFAPLRHAGAWWRTEAKEGRRRAARWRPRADRALEPVGPGAGRLGDLAIRYGYYRFETDVMMFTVTILVVLVQLIQLTGTRAARRLDKR